MPVQVTLVGKPGCHLCDDAREVVAEVLQAVAAAPHPPDLAFEELSILDHPDLHERFVEEIPVVLIDGRVHNYWRIDGERLRRALLDRP